MAVILGCPYCKKDKIRKMGETALGLQYRCLNPQCGLVFPVKIDKKQADKGKKK